MFTIILNFTDTQDYLICTLLNAVVPSTCRFKNASGENKRKITISDAHESFAVRVSSINDYQQKLNELVNKYFLESCTVQPFLIIEGNSSEDLTGFFIYFDGNLFQFDSFFACLDTCFKMFHVFSIDYPKACNPLWVFIQLYFFDINTISDCKSSNLTSLLNFMNSHQQN